MAPLYTVQNLGPHPPSPPPLELSLVHQDPRLVGEMLHTAEGRNRPPTRVARIPVSVSSVRD